MRFQFDMNFKWSHQFRLFLWLLFYVFQLNFVFNGWLYLTTVVCRHAPRPWRERMVLFFGWTNNSAVGSHMYQELKLLTRCQRNRIYLGWYTPHTADGRWCVVQRGRKMLIYLATNRKSWNSRFYASCHLNSSRPVEKQKPQIDCFLLSIAAEKC